MSIANRHRLIAKALVSAAIVFGALIGAEHRPAPTRTRPAPSRPVQRPQL